MLVGFLSLLKCRFPLGKYNAGLAHSKCSINTCGKRNEKEGRKEEGRRKKEGREKGKGGSDGGKKREKLQRKGEVKYSSG